MTRRPSLRRLEIEKGEHNMMMFLHMNFYKQRFNNFSCAGGAQSASTSANGPRQIIYLILGLFN